MELSDLKSHNIGILGFGQEGQAVFSYLKKHGITATVFDENENLSASNFSSASEGSGITEFANIKFITGENYLDSIGECNLIFRSPGIWRNHPKILEAETAGSIITSQAKWFFEHSKAKIIGVTGTKGKGTTSSLIYETLKAAKKSAYLTGNIGKIQPLEFLDDLSETDLVVYELSSFQLQDLTQSPTIGVCLMVTSDHLNHHSDLGEYHSAKAAIGAFQNETDTLIYNSDYEATKKIGGLGKGSKLEVSAETKPTKGAYITGDKIQINLEGSDGFELDCTHRKLRGAHNLENIAASSLVCKVLNIETNVIAETANSFVGLEHRLQFVGTYKDVSYYNDSISTVPETTIAALNAFVESIHLILGGSDKGLSYEQLSKDISKYTNVKSITLLGETGIEMQKLLQENAPNLSLFGPYIDLKTAFDALQTRTAAGDVVLLSPASASFDMFKNYADRGNQFVKLVQSI